MSAPFAAAVATAASAAVAARRTRAFSTSHFAHGATVNPAAGGSAWQQVVSSPSDPASSSSGPWLPRGSGGLAAAGSLAAAVTALRHGWHRRAAPAAGQSSRCIAACRVSRRAHSIGAAPTVLDAEGAAVVAQLQQPTEQLRELRDLWASLPAADGTGTAEQLLNRYRALRSQLQQCSLGDPGDVTTVPRRVSGDGAVAAHGEATRALVEAELAQLAWEVRTGDALGHSRGSKGSPEVENFARLLVSMAVLQLRCFDTAAAYLTLQRTVDLGLGMYVDPRLGMLTRYCSLLHAPRHPETLAPIQAIDAGSAEETLLREVYSTFVMNDYRVGDVLKFTKASSMSEFIFVESRADQLEKALLESCMEPNPMQPELEAPQASGTLVDLIRLFLLHRVLPLARFGQIFGLEPLKLMLRLRMVQAVDGDGCRIVDADDAMRAVAADPTGCEALFGFSNVAVWPVEEDLLFCTDFEQTFSDQEMEPVMYISEDSLALVCGAPRSPVNHVLDLCCGSGIQGIVALRYYAQQATFVDLNPRAVRFTKLNALMNGVADRVVGIHHGALYEALPQGAGPYDAIVANPPFVPNPLGIASGAGAMFGDGGDTGEGVLAGIVHGAPRVLAPGGRVATVSMAPNVEEMPQRLQGWFQSGSGGAAVPHQGLVFRGQPTPADRYQPTSSQAETRQYQSAFKQMGISTLSEVVTVLALLPPGTPSVGCSLAGEFRSELWGDHQFLRVVVQKAHERSATPVAQTAGSAVGVQELPPQPQRQSPPKPTRAPAAAAAPAAQAAPPKPVRQPEAAAPTPAPAAAPAQAAPSKPARQAPPAAAPAAPSPPPQRPAQQRMPDRSREGCLPGFQPAFFPAHCQGPTPEWQPTAQELAQLLEQQLAGKSAYYN
eukprot:TRINITY_DN20219_c0_g1_i1.p1 TRINITY_DN20219_c0_g1~~TRINITY_DN20219_c0_g1_i1.p1  ORF type:complete len:888 (-),score=128.75 TRINITY_DN20219_c0_g1_i1:238-2901(-)